MTTDILENVAGGGVIGPEAGEAQARRAATRHRARRLVLVALGWAAMLAAWQWGSTQFQGTVFPGPVLVATEAWEIITSGRFVEHFWASVWKTFAGFGLAVLAGVPIGYLMGTSRYWRAFFHDSMTVSGTIPSITYAVLSLIIFGISYLGPIMAVALVSIPYVALNVAEGVRGADEQLVKMSQAFGRTKAQIRRHVFLPSLVPFVFAAIRLSFAVAWKVEALTEVFGGRNGIGFQIQAQYQSFSVPGVLAWTMLFIAFMLIIERVVLVRLEDRLLAWRPKERIRG